MAAQAGREGRGRYGHPDDGHGKPLSRWAAEPGQCGGAEASASTVRRRCEVLVEGAAVARKEGLPRSGTAR
ncbi:hypothetical protein TNCT6_15710 [Streptomyces sp. 6-11-2]|nr:hypothetical protein TNCT6_15710 [Streptomyces sp. 6-11-2]